MRTQEQRYVARLRDDGEGWCVMDRRTGGYAVPATLRLDELPEDTAKLLTEKLNQSTTGPTSGPTTGRREDG